MESNTIAFHASAAFLLTMIPLLATIAVILIRENSSSLFSLSNMLSAGLFFALGVTGHHAEDVDKSPSFYFAKNVVIGTTFALMIFRNQAAGGKAAAHSVKYSRVGETEDDGIEMQDGSSESKSNAFDFALDAPSGISPHFPIILAVFSYFSFIEAMQFAQVDHTGYGTLAAMLLNKVMMSICFGTAAAADSVLSKALPKLSPVFFASSPLGVLAGVLVTVEIPLLLTKYTYFTINGVCLYVATLQLLPEELKIKDATALKMSFFAIGFFAVFSTEYFMY